MDRINSNAIGMFLLAAVSFMRPIQVWSDVPATGADPCGPSLYGLVIEGSFKEAGAIEKGFHDAAKKWAEAFSEFTETTVVVPPLGTLTTLYAPDPKIADEIRATVNEVPRQNLCNKVGQKFAEFALGTSEIKSHISESEALSHSSSKILIDRLNLGKSTSLPSSALATAIKNKRKRCPTVDQTVMVTIKDHGSSDCRIWLNENKGLTPAQVYLNIISPLMDSGAKVIMNFDSCYSGCFVDAIAKTNGLPKPICMTSSARKETVGYYSDGVVKGTYEVTYPDYLHELKNPLKAHICATLWDPLNMPAVAGFATEQKRKDRSLNDDRANVLNRIATKFNFPNIARECHPPRQSAATNLGLTESQIKTLFACPQVKSAMSQALGDAQMVNQFLEPVTDIQNAPGLTALEKLLTDESEIAGLLSGCNIDLSRYTLGANNQTPAQKAIPPTPSLMPAQGVK